VETLRQNLHPFQAEENARNAAIDKAFSMTGSQNDPLEGVKIPLKRASLQVMESTRSRVSTAAASTPRRMQVCLSLAH
jgi:hypothetical protein